MVNFQERFIDRYEDSSLVMYEFKRTTNMYVEFVFLFVKVNQESYIVYRIIDLFDNSNQEFYIFDRDVADGLYFDRTHPIRLVSLMVSENM